MTDDPSVIDWLFKAFATACMGIIAFFTKRVVNDVAELQRNSAKCEVDLANYKTHVSDNYAKETTMQQSLSRIHDRIDDMATDIKTIISKVK